MRTGTYCSVLYDYCNNHYLYTCRNSIGCIRCNMYIELYDTPLVVSPNANLRKFITPKGTNTTVHKKNPILNCKHNSVNI